MKRQGRRANLFLIELVLNLFIFAICAAVCVGLLVHARGMSMESARLTQAVYAAQTVAETWKVTGALPDGARPDETGLITRAEERDGVLTVAVLQGGQEIYRLEEVRRIG